MRDARRRPRRAVSLSDTAATTVDQRARSSLRATATLPPPPPPPPLPLDTSRYTTFVVTRREASQPTRRDAAHPMEIYSSFYVYERVCVLSTCRSLRWPLGLITNSRGERDISERIGIFRHVRLYVIVSCKCHRRKKEEIHIFYSCMIYKN